MDDKAILTQELEKVEEGFGKIIMGIPRRDEPPPFTPYWLHLEILERYNLLLNAGITRETTIIEIGCGPSAIATVALAYFVGNGHVCAVDRGRWRCFEEILHATRLRGHVSPVMCDATQLPFNPGFDMAVSIHAIRSFHDESTITTIFEEMFRVSPSMFICESLPISKTRAQRAHMEMYNLREEIFEALSGKKDDIHYLSLEKLVELVKSAGGTVTESRIVDVNLPHYLAFIPKDIIEKIEDSDVRVRLLKRWERAYTTLKKYGEEHPPVGMIRAVRK